ncbi:hypothetical protein DYD21_17175 [Rhodohalobacter sp. SW132]|uniref:hypothetical protein n=1 Tax=Rhodohalobacter sp. SW132 TaxID=2293433 RepID=UPI000E22DF30|nr:hypothetical protein [Rhodohalobacter sp. SW132]REL24886.1 hypothetical protein DYD21_17175 [Rhodohalobacter sp. SW132]
MDLKEKKPLIYSVSAAVIILVVFTVMSGTPLKKLVIPGFFEAEFDSRSEPSSQSAGEVAIPDRTVTPIESQRNLTDAGGSLVEPDIANQTPGQRTEVPEVHREVSSPNGRTAITEESATRQSVTGIWYGDDGSVYEITQYGNTVEFVEYGMFGITASGNGTVSGAQISLSYETVFGTMGSANLNISENSRVLTGRANDHVSGGYTLLRLTRE